MSTWSAALFAQWRWLAPTRAHRLMYTTIFIAIVWLVISRWRRRRAPPAQVAHAPTSASSSVNAPATPASKLTAASRRSAGSQSLHAQYCMPNEQLLTVCVCLDGILFAQQSDKAASVAASGVEAFDQGVVATLLKLARHSSLHVLVSNIQSDSNERHCRSTLADIGLYDAGLKPHRVLISATHTGKVAVVRQLEPSLYIDSDETSVRALEPHLPRVALITANDVEVTKATRVASLADLFPSN